MEEIDKLLCAKEYIDKMANGIDPTTDMPVAENDLINNVKITRCFFYVSKILERAIAHEAAQPKKKLKRKSLT